MSRTTSSIKAVIQHSIVSAEAVLEAAGALPAVPARRRRVEP